jgi:hypothetical protein
LCHADFTMLDESTGVWKEIVPTFYSDNSNN